MKRLIRIHDWLLRTGFCTLWLISGAWFVFTAAAGLAETDSDIGNALMIRAGYFGAVMLFGMLAHAYLIHEHKKKNPPEDDGNYPNWDF